MSERTNLIRYTEAKENEVTFSHPLNPESEINGIQVSRMTGMERVNVNFGRLTPGHDSFVYHNQHSEEEWLYVISGRGIAEIDGETYEVGSGDFMGFPTPSVAHNLTNPPDSEEDLVYLMGGENNEVEIADFPRLGKRLLRTPESAEIVDADDVRPLFEG